jgi:hypothetical protein
MHEGEMGVIETVLHQSQRSCLLLIIELEDAAEAGPAVLGDIEERQQLFFSATHT